MRCAKRSSRRKAGYELRFRVSRGPFPPARGEARKYRLSRSVDRYPVCQLRDAADPKLASDLARKNHTLWRIDELIAG